MTHPTHTRESIMQLIRNAQGDGPSGPITACELEDVLTALLVPQPEVWRYFKGIGCGLWRHNGTTEEHYASNKWDAMSKAAPISDFADPNSCFIEITPARAERFISEGTVNQPYSEEDARREKADDVGFAKDAAALLKEEAASMLTPTSPTAPDPGEGWRLLVKETTPGTGEVVIKDDEIWIGNKWNSCHGCAGNRSMGAYFRRRTTPEQKPMKDILGEEITPRRFETLMAQLSDRDKQIATLTARLGLAEKVVDLAEKILTHGCLSSELESKVKAFREGASQ